MDHHTIADIDANVRRASGVIGFLEEDQVAGLCIRRGNITALPAQAVGCCTPNAPPIAAVIDNPADEAGAVKTGAWGTAAPHIRHTKIFFGFLNHPCELFIRSDEKFARMIEEAEKYLGMPYVWGGSSPSTSFDCSGFVCWVINNCGNGWSVGRTTANGLRGKCSYVSPADAKPGDLIFFEKTYNTAGASHVGIYVGNGMMIHCGDPISYTSINSTYWQSHFLGFGRIN